MFLEPTKIEKHISNEILFNANNLGSKNVFVGALVVCSTVDMLASFHPVPSSVKWIMLNVYRVFGKWRVRLLGVLNTLLRMP